MDIPAAPEGWNGPMVWTFIGKCVRGDDQKMVKFQDFEEAIAAANEIKKCGGITKTSTGYSLRMGTKCVGNKVGSRSGMASWTKITAPTKKVSPKKKNVVDDVVVTTANAAPEDSKKKSQKKKKQTKTFKPKEPEPEPESEDEMEVEPVEIDGITYYKDDKDVLWDPDSGDEVGKYVDGKLVAN